ncbi:MAG TPA: DUF6111 family protein [Stellaceae bacterium]|nr:DUF6111 family protein [Stellaceae bacterium]
MTRVVLTVIVPLLLPTAIYLLWVVSVRRARPAAAMTWQGLPWLWLVLAGIVLAAAALLVLVAFGRQGGGTYVPPHVEDGRIVPGHVLPSAPAQH